MLPAGKSVDFELPDGDGAVKRCAAVPAPLRCHILPTLMGSEGMRR